MTEQLWCLRLAINLHLTGDCANKAACLLLFKEERRNIGEINTGTRCVCRVYSTAINQGKLLVGVLLGYRVYPVLHQEPYANDHICLLCRCVDVFGVFSVADHLRLNDHVRETKLRSSLFVACMGKLVEAAIIQATNVGHYSHPYTTHFSFSARLGSSTFPTAT